MYSLEFAYMQSKTITIFFFFTFVKLGWVLCHWVKGLLL